MRQHAYGAEALTAVDRLGVRLSLRAVRRALPVLDRLASEGRGKDGGRR